MSSYRKEVAKRYFKATQFDSSNEEWISIDDACQQLGLDLGKQVEELSWDGFSTVRLFEDEHWFRGQDLIMWLLRLPSVENSETKWLHDFKNEASQALQTPEMIEKALQLLRDLEEPNDGSMPIPSYDDD